MVRDFSSSRVDWGYAPPECFRNQGPLLGQNCVLYHLELPLPPAIVWSRSVQLKLVNPAVYMLVLSVASDGWVQLKDVRLWGMIMISHSCGCRFLSSLLLIVPHLSLVGVICGR